jgi:hypothetical protein
MSASTLRACFLSGSRFSYSSVCHHCGASESGIKWFIPGTQVCYLHPVSVHPTPVSEVLEATGIVGAHEHKWWLAHGSGNRIFCAIGQGRHLRDAVESDNVAAIISAAHHFGDIAFRDRVVKALLDPKTSRSVFHLGHRAKPGAFTTREDFRSWQSEKSAFFFEELTMAQAE